MKQTSLNSAFQIKKERLYPRSWLNFEPEISGLELERTRVPTYKILPLGCEMGFLDGVQVQSTCFSSVIDRHVVAGKEKDAFFFYLMNRWWWD